MFGGGALWRLVMFAMIPAVSNGIEIEIVRPDPSNCTMIIYAGMPRAGSTLEATIGNHIVEFLARHSETDFKFVNGYYWDYANHTHMPEEEANEYYKKQANLWRQWRKVAEQQKILIAYKSHEFKPKLLEFCHNSIVLGSHRCVRDELMSILNSFFRCTDDSGVNILPKECQIKKPIGIFKTYMYNDEKWRMFGQEAGKTYLDFDYEAYLENKLPYFRAFAEKLATAIGYSVLGEDDLQDLNTRFLAQAANKKFLGKGQTEHKAERSSFTLDTLENMITDIKQLPPSHVAHFKMDC